MPTHFKPTDYYEYNITDQNDWFTNASISINIYIIKTYYYKEITRMEHNHLSIYILHATTI